MMHQRYSDLRPISPSGSSCSADGSSSSIDAAEAKKKHSLSRVTRVMVVTVSMMILHTVIPLQNLTNPSPIAAWQNAAPAPIDGGVLEIQRQSHHDRRWDTVYPRTFFLEGEDDIIVRERQIDPITETMDQQYSTYEDRFPKEDITKTMKWGLPLVRKMNSMPRGNEHSDCVFSAKWQTDLQLNCNQFHEVDDAAFASGLLGVGSQRGVWKIDDNVEHHGVNSTAFEVGNPRSAYVLKRPMISKRIFNDNDKFNCKPQKSFTHFQRLDAAVSARLTSTPTLVDIYGFCGYGSVLNELGTMQGDYESAGEHLQHGEASISISFNQRLGYARDITSAISDMHAVRVVHGDLSPSNTLFVGNVAKLSDVNQGVYLGIRRSKSDQQAGNETCGYVRHENICSNYSALEECIHSDDPDTIRRTDKTDVYHLGGMILYYLTGNSPYHLNPNDGGRLNKDKTAMLPPKIPVKIQQMAKSNRYVAAMLRAVEACHEPNREERASASEVLRILNEV